MENTKGLLESIKQHPKLNISVGTHESKPLPEAVLSKLLKPHRTNYYVFLFIAHGSTRQTVDLKEWRISGGELLFILPNCVYESSLLMADVEFFKIGLDDSCLALLPQQFAFLINPFHTNLISFDASARERVYILFRLITRLLQDNYPQDTSIILSYLNSLLTELNRGYFRNITKESISGNHLSVFVEFKFIIEKYLTKQYTIKTIASQLGISENCLFRIIKEYTGMSPKEYIMQRVMLEARRKLFYSGRTAKELAYELGYNDPEYFSRLFKHYTGKTISQFRKEMQDLSGS